MIITQLRGGENVEINPSTYPGNDHFAASLSDYLLRISSLIHSCLIVMEDEPMQAGSARWESPSQS